jgi:hypothetical protein
MKIFRRIWVVLNEIRNFRYTFLLIGSSGTFLGFYIASEGGFQRQSSLALLLLVSGSLIGAAAWNWLSLKRPQKRSHVNLNPSPPRPCLLLLAMVTSGRDREAVLGDAFERFSKESKRFGSRWATLLMLRDIAVSIVPLVWLMAKRVGVGLGIAKFIAWISR